MKPYSLDLRTHVAAACQQAGARQQQVADFFGVSVSFIKKLRRRARETGSLAPKAAIGGLGRALSADEQQWLVAYAGQHADATLAELKVAWQTALGHPMGQTSFWNVLDEHHLRRKKSVHASKHDTQRVQQVWAAHVETVCTRPSVKRLHFWMKRVWASNTLVAMPERWVVSGAVPLTRGRSLTRIEALVVKGLGAIQLLKRALNQRSFAWYVTEYLAPMLQPGNMLVLDDLSVHKLVGVGEWLAERGVGLPFLPSYSPDFSPIEQAWGRLKTKLRTPRPGTREELTEALQGSHRLNHEPRCAQLA